jgi:hypothetical protein
MPSVQEYVVFSWEASTEANNKSGIAVFDFLERPVIKATFPSFQDAWELYQSMVAIADMAYADGRLSIKKQIEKL